MAEYKGGEGDVMRIRALQKFREQEKKEMEAKLSKMQEDSSRGLVAIDQKFSNPSSSREEQLKASTVGLVTLEDFRRKRIDIESEDYLQREKEKVEVPKKVKKPRIEKSKLSFDTFDEEEEEQEEEPPVIKKSKVSSSSDNADNGEDQSDKSASKDSNGSGNEEQTKKKKFGKNPFVETSFLPDREREEQERREREELTKQWKEEQERIKNEDIDITYSYWDGSGHRKSTTVKKGWTISRFLEKVRSEFKELRGVGVDNMMFVKEDLIIPQHFSFYDLILMKARGKSGPLFHFDVHEDVRFLSDATKEKDESHAGKVVERRWYERNKHIFPASRWEVFDPVAQRDQPYSLKDSKKDLLP